MTLDNLVEDLSDEDIEIIKKYKDTQKRLISQKMDLYIPSLRDMIKSGTIDLNPTFQRRDRWTRKQQSRLIESIIMGVPIPPVFLAEEEYNKYSVMDGKQRLTAISSYLKNEYALTGLLDWGELNGKSFKKLNSTLQSAITRRSISSVVIAKESDLDIKFDVFERINTGGANLNPQEVRNCIFRGPFNDLIIELSTLKTYQNALDLPTKKELLIKTRIFQHMEDVQLVLRFFVLQNYQEISGNLKTTMNNYMEKAMKFEDKELNEHRDHFIETLEKVYSVYKRQSFRKWDLNEKKWGVISGPMYDAVMYGFSKISIDDIRGNERKILNGTKHLYEDEDFVESIRKGTNSKEANEIRLGKFLQMLKSTTG